MKITIIGKGRGWDKAPNKDDGEFWGLTQVNLLRPVDKVIDMNDYNLWGEEEARDAFLSRTSAKWEGVDYIDRDNYPLREIIDFFGTDYFTNTCDYVIALAVFKGARQIEIYGVNMEHESEYAYQLPGVSFWVGIAMGKGVKTTVHGEYTTLLKSEGNKLYGYGIPRIERR